MESSAEANAKLRQRVRQQSAVADLGQQALEADDLDRLMHDAAAVVVDTLDADYGTVLELRPETDVLALRQGVGWRDGVVGSATVPTDADSQAGYTVGSERPIIVDDLRTEDRFTAPELLTGHDVVSGISVVIGTVDARWGVLGVHTADRRDFTDDDATFVTNVANVLAAAVERSEKQRRLRERERQLDRFKAYSDAVIDAVDDVVYVLDENGDLQRWNDSAREVTGFTDTELDSMHALDFFRPSDADAIADAIATCLETGTARVQADFVTNAGDGPYVPYEFVATAFDDPAGNPVVAGIGRDLTDRRQRDRELAAYERIVETITDGIYVIDDAYRYTMVNEAFAEMSGYDRDELLGTHATRIVDDDTLERATALREEMDDDASAKPTLDTTMETADGERIPVEVTFAALPTDDGPQRVGVVRDVTEREAQRRKLAESERRYRTLVEHFPNGAVGLFDEDLCYTAVGGQLLDAAGVDPADRIGNRVSDVYPDDIVDEVEPYFHAALDGEANAFEVDYHDRNLFAHTLPIGDDDGVYAGMLVVQDVTERREYQRRLEESNERLEQFAYAASHDLQEPLRMVSSYLQLIDRRYGEAFGDDGAEFLDFAVDGAERMRNMIDGLLAYSRVESRGGSFEPVDLEAVLADVRNDLLVTIDERDAEITADSLPTVEGDADQLRQVFQNLLSNAIQYSTDAPRVRVAAERTGSTWTVSVADDGVGIDPDDQERIFEVFQRAHSSRASTGTGIGLALCKRIVERHGGDIWVESTPDEGTTVSVTLPAVDEEING